MCGRSDCKSQKQKHHLLFWPELDLLTLLSWRLVVRGKEGQGGGSITCAAADCFVSAENSRQASLKGHCQWGLCQHRRVNKSGSDVSSSC